MTQKIEKFIIGMLGGYTFDEARDMESRAYNIGVYNAYNIMKRHADAINGCNADDWCESVYGAIKNGYDCSSKSIKDMRHEY